MAHCIKDNSFGIADLQEKMLGLLCELIRVCDENQLTYWACGGTCIGALRHDGFIPWDDDLDVYMPRDDYEKLWEIRDRFNLEQFILCRTTKDRNYHHRVQQLVDINTTFINQRSADEDIEHGVYIDIIPMDACAPSGFPRLRQIFNSVLFSIYNVQCLPEFHGGKAFRLAVGAALKLVPGAKSRYRIWSNSEKRMTHWSWDSADRVVELAASMKVLLNPYPKEWFSGVRKHKFEDIEINLPIGVEDYLTQVFGDYVSLPPESERHPRHNTVLIDLNNSYKQYKGTYYCVKEKK